MHRAAKKMVFAAQLLFVLLVLGVSVQRWAEKREEGA